jgi:hypothetical protein
MKKASLFEAGLRLICGKNEYNPAVIAKKEGSAVKFIRIGKYSCPAG